MEWSALYRIDNQPDWSNICDYVNSELWLDINLFLQDTYKVSPRLTYSKCSMQKGWNIKYQKSGKSLCTLYPMNGYFIALVVIGEKEITEAELLITTCCDYIKELFEKTVFSAGGRWLMINVMNSQILEDTKSLIELRVKPR